MPLAGNFIVYAQSPKLGPPVACIKGRISFFGSLCGDRFGFLSERSAELQLGSVQRIGIPSRPSWSSAFLQKRRRRF